MSLLLLDANRLAKARAAMHRPGVTAQAWHALLRDLRERTGGDHILAANAALAYRLTDETHYATTCFVHVSAAAANLATMSGGLTVGDHLTYLALAFDWAQQEWTEPQRTDIRQALETGAEFLATYHWPNLDDGGDKSSNWVAVCRGGELMARLAIRPDADRVPFLVEELCRHLDEGYGDTGWAQEGYDYLRYAADTGFVPAVLSALHSGIGDLAAAWRRPQFANLILHTQSLRPGGHRLQFGVGERVGTPSPGFLNTGTPPVRRAYQWLFERAVTEFPPGTSDPLWTLLCWPGAESGAPQDLGALLDHREGAFYFRNRYRNADDTLVGFTNRNRRHHGWSVPETFAISLIGQGTTWALMPDKQKSVHLYSKPLIDGRPIPDEVADGQGVTRAARPFPGQGGGYVSLDGHRNYGIDHARRDVVVDMRAVAGADTVIAIHDSFADGRPHTIDWQLAPQPGVDITHGGTENGMSAFLLRHDDAWLKGWLLDPGGALFSVHNGALRITRRGTAIDFRIVLAVGRGEPPIASRNGNALTLGEVTYDTERLAAFAPESGAPAPGTRPTLHLQLPSGPFMRGVAHPVSATLGWWSPRPARDVTLDLQVPEGWRAETDMLPASGLAEGEQTTARWLVTAGEGTPGTQKILKATYRGDEQTGLTVATAAAELDRLNVAMGKPARQSSTLGVASRAVDGNTDGMWGHGSVSHTQEEIQPWWQVDLEDQHDIGEIVLWNRTDASAERLRDFYVMLSPTPFPDRKPLADLLARNDIWHCHNPGAAGRTTTVAVNHPGRHVRIQLAQPEPTCLQLAEVQVFPR